MTPPHPPTPPPAGPVQRRAFQFGAIRTLLPHLWPREDRGLRARVVLALLCLATAKIANVYVPIFYKHAVDALTPQVQHGAAAAVAALPVGMILAYGAARVLAQFFAELRDYVFAKVQARAIRKLALGVFRHLHALSMRFHIERQTGGLSRAIERGTNGIDNLLSYTLFSIFPTLFEILLVCGVLWGLYDLGFAAVTFVTIVAYIAYTLGVTEWRIKFRRAMNQSDSEANTKAIDSLLNYETVKYFGNEEHEARRYDQALVKYERAAIKSHTTLSLLNIGQGFIIAVGVTVIMLMAASGVDQTVINRGRPGAGPAAPYRPGSSRPAAPPGGEGGAHRSQPRVNSSGRSARGNRTRPAAPALRLSDQRVASSTLPSWAWAAARRATGTRKGEQLT